MRAFELEANGMVFRGHESGPADGPLALLAHGFPDTPDTWRHLREPLASKGYHVVIPAMRGYAPSDVPSDGRYQGAALALDLIELTRAFGGDESSVLIGHDWGAVAAYGAAALSPTSWRALVTLAVPPMGSVASAFLSPDQLKRSWYIFFFQTAAAEFMVSYENYRLIEKLWADWSPGFDALADLNSVRKALDTPERIAAAVGYYRAMFDTSLHDPALADVQVRLGDPLTIPTLYLHGRNDGCMSYNDFGDPLAFLPDGSEVQLVDHAGHFLQLEQPAAVNNAILKFLGSAS